MHLQIWSMMTIFMLLLLQRQTNKQTPKLVIWSQQESSLTHLFPIATYQHHIMMEKLVFHALNLSFCSTQRLKNVLLVMLLKFITAHHANVKKEKLFLSQQTLIISLQLQRNLLQIISKNFMIRQINKEIILLPLVKIQVTIVIIPIVSHVNLHSTLVWM